MKIQSIILSLQNPSNGITKPVLSTFLKDQEIHDFELVFFDQMVCCIYNHKKDLREHLTMKLVENFDLDLKYIWTFFGDKPVYRNLIDNLMQVRVRDINFLVNWNGILSKETVIVLEKLWNKIEEQELDIHRDRAVISRMLHETTNLLY